MVNTIINMIENLPSNIIQNIPFIAPEIKSAIWENIQSIQESIEE